MWIVGKYQRPASKGIPPGSVSVYRFYWCRKIGEPLNKYGKPKKSRRCVFGDRTGRIGSPGWFSNCRPRMPFSKITPLFFKFPLISEITKWHRIPRSCYFIIEFNGFFTFPFGKVPKPKCSGKLFWNCFPAKGCKWFLVGLCWWLQKISWAAGASIPPGSHSNCSNWLAALSIASTAVPFRCWNKRGGLEYSPSCK